MKKKVIKGWISSADSENDVLQNIEWDCRSILYPTRQEYLRGTGSKAQKCQITVMVEHLK